MADGNPRAGLHFIQFGCIIWAGLVKPCPAFYFYRFFGAMVGNALGYNSPCSWMEAHENWHTSVDREHPVDGSVHHFLENAMNDMKYELLTELHSRLEADLLESYLEANGIDVELVQESIGHNIYPVTVDGLGHVQVFIPKEKVKAAKKLLEKFNSEE